MILRALVRVGSMMLVVYDVYDTMIPCMGYILAEYG